MKTRLGRVLNSLYWKFYRYFSNNIFFYKGLKKWDLIVFDDIFPHPQSGFRISEIGFLLKNIK
ncbi:MAG TPA: glycosyltransferase, partial [Chryseobacterium sp.]|nr:glycosyltransferase [Chryseobacterium sp.]